MTWAFVDEFCCDLNKNSSSLQVILDFLVVFNTADHCILLDYLEKLGVRGTTLCCSDNSASLLGWFRLWGMKKEESSGCSLMECCRVCLSALAFNAHVKITREQASKPAAWCVFF